MKRFAVLLLLLMVTAASAEGLFEGLLPDVTAAPATPTPTAAPAPAPEESLLPLEAYAALLGMPEVVETADGTALRYTGVDLPRFAAFAAMLSPRGLRLIQHDVAEQALLVLLTPQGALPAQLPAPLGDEAALCSLCRGWGKCRTCWSMAELDCAACWDGSCRWCTDGYTYEGRGQKVDCRKCRGTDRCHECSGAGSFDCPDCMDGECSACGGSGYQ